VIADEMAGQGDVLGGAEIGSGHVSDHEERGGDAVVLQDVQDVGVFSPFGPSSNVNQTFFIGYAFSARKF